jgi:hypothetical protein
LFDLILTILEVLINEQINASTALSGGSAASNLDADASEAQQQEQQQQNSMQIDTGSQQATEKVQEESEAVTHVQIFLSLI